jgi:N-acetylmuramoyl-L-alanine amidase
MSNHCLWGRTSRIRAAAAVCLAMLVPSAPSLARSFSASDSVRPAPQNPSQIGAVRVQGRGRDATVRVRADRPCRVVRHRLRQPERLVLDFSPARWGGSHPSPDRGGPVRTVRIAQHPGSRVRLVVDTGARPTRWKGRFRGAEWVGRGQALGPSSQGHSAPLASASEGSRSLRGMVIGIDPGHGGSDPGAIARCGLKEKDVTLRLARLLRRLLRRQGARVLMTRADDRHLPIEARKVFVSERGLDLVISLHCDAYDGTPHCTGITTYFHEGRRRSQDLAEALQRRLASSTRMPNRGARSDRSLYDSGLYVLRNASCPAVLIETGYISCAATAARLRDPGFRLQAAQGIVAGLRQYVTDAPVRTARR